MKTGLPAEINPIQLAEEGTRLAGVLPISALPRLRQECVGDSGQIKVDLLFEASNNRHRLMSGELALDCQILCQRCLQPMKLALKTGVRTVLKTADEQTESDQESIVVTGRVPLSNLVEDDLLLAMPMIPMHDRSDCSATKHMVADDLQKGAVSSDKSPFAVLGALKKGDN